MIRLDGQCFESYLLSAFSYDSQLTNTSSFHHNSLSNTFQPPVLVDSISTFPSSSIPVGPPPTNTSRTPHIRNSLFPRRSWLLSFLVSKRKRAHSLHRLPILQLSTALIQLANTTFSMKLPGNTLWLAGCVGTAVGFTGPQEDASMTRPHHSSLIYASSRALAQPQLLASTHMYASSHTLAQRQATVSPALATSVSLVSSVVSKSTAVAPTNIVTALTPSKDLVSISSIPAPDVVQVEAITTVTSFLGASPPPKASTRSTGFASVASTSTVEEIVTVTSVLPSVTFPDPQSQVQGPTSGPSISFVPVPSTTAKSAPTTATRPKTVLSAAAYKYLGCYAEGLNVRALGDASFPDDGNTIERCVTACYPYKYAGAEYGRECWCGNELKGASKVSEYDFCNMPCAGNGEQYCGGIVALNVYVVGDAPSASFIPVTVSGTAIMSRKPSSVTATSSSSQVSISKSPQSQAIVSSTSSSAAASTRSPLQFLSRLSRPVPRVRSRLFSHRHL
ncbi:hypothetical protein ONS96_008312 [Cadophora gregata f. sp. sojae]|nr:hypothetical protein ONS96_008312 [Cadophora gregata f. sp. sojae]